MFILPSSFIGSPRALQPNFIDAMTLVQKFGKPDFFITVTCNARWEEIVNNIRNDEDACNRPDVVVRVFNQKVKEFKNEILNKAVLGKCITYTYVIEFQKKKVYLTFIFYYF